MKRSSGRNSTITRRTHEREGRRRVLAGLAAVAIAPVKPKARALRASTPDEALRETYEALAHGAAPWNPVDAKADYMNELSKDFQENFRGHWNDDGAKVKMAAVASGILAALIAEGTGASPDKLTKTHVFMGSAIVKASKACRGSGMRARGRFCESADFGSVPDALKALLKVYPPT